MLFGLGKSDLGGYNSGLNSLIAQLVERRTVNPQVPGSSPGRGARILEGHAVAWPFFNSGYGYAVDDCCETPQ